MANYSDIAAYLAENKTVPQIVDLLQAETIRVDNHTMWTFGLIETAIDYWLVWAWRIYSWVSVIWDAWNKEQE